MASIIRVKRISELETTSAITSNWSTVSVFLRSVLMFLPTADVPSSLILSTLMMEAILSSET
jgi:hypothetical protein